MTEMLERRRYPRFAVRLPSLLTVRRLADKAERQTVIQFSEDVSNTGLCFTAKRRIDPGLSIEAEVILLGHGPGGSDLHISGAGYIVRAEECDESGWFRMAATFDEPPAGAALGWNQLTATFNDPPSSLQDS